MRRSLLPAYSLMMMNRGGAAAQPDEWISIHNTALRTGSTTILLPFGTSTGNRTIDWGDGVVEVINTANPSHTYATNGVYTVTVRGGTTTRLGTASNANNDDGWRMTCTEVTSWGKLGWTSFENAFRGHIPNVKLPSYLPNTVASFARMFLFAESFNQPIGSWDTKNITDMRDMFAVARAFNQPIGNWNTANVTTMQSMFDTANAFNQDISTWNVSSVTTFTGMFDSTGGAPTALAFNQNLGAWQLRRAGVTMPIMLDGTALSVENYSRTLIGWANYVAATNTPATVTLGGGTRKYNATVYAAGSTYTNAVDARAYLVTAAPNGPGWTITDGGLA